MPNNEMMVSNDPVNLTVESPFLSVIVPIYNEADNIMPLIQEIRTALDGQWSYEMIYIDDGSTDESWTHLQNLALTVKPLRLIRHRRCYGQSLAILTGVKAARAEWIVTLDGDGQNDPADIPKLIAVLQTAEASSPLQMVAGYRAQRQDRWLKRIASWISNQVRRSLLHDKALDTGCSLKLFSRQAFLTLPHFDHMHRFLHALFLRNGGQIIAIEVNHRPRLRGQSKYGLWDRLWIGIIDLLGVKWLQMRPCLSEVIEDNQAHVK